MGSNLYGQLGLGNSDLTSNPSPHLIEELADIKIDQIACGAYFSLAISQSGQVFSWGDAAYGQLGYGTYTKQTYPVKMQLPKIMGQVPRISSVSAGSKHCALLTEDGEVLVTGCNKNGQLGIGNYINSTKPVLNNFIVDKVELVCCGENHTQVYTKTQKVLAFGSNDQGQLNLPSSKNSNMPIPLNGYNGSERIVQQIAGNYSGYLDELGNLYLWGFKDDDTLLPQLQEFDMKIKRVSLLKDTCQIIDELGRVLTFDAQNRNQNNELIENCFSVKLEGKNILKVASGNDFFLCLPEKTHNISEDSWTIRKNEKEGFGLTNKQSVQGSGDNLNLIDQKINFSSRGSNPVNQKGVGHNISNNEHEEHINNPNNHESFIFVKNGQIENNKIRSNRNESIDDISPMKQDFQNLDKNMKKNQSTRQSYLDKIDEQLQEYSTNKNHNSCNENIRHSCKANKKTSEESDDILRTVQSPTVLDNELENQSGENLYNNPTGFCDTVNFNEPTCPHYDNYPNNQHQYNSNKYNINTNAVKDAHQNIPSKKGGGDISTNYNSRTSYNKNSNDEQYSYKRRFLEQREIENLPQRNPRNNPYAESTYRFEEDTLQSSACNHQNQQHSKRHHHNVNKENLDENDLDYLYNQKQQSFNGKHQQYWKERTIYFSEQYKQTEKENIVLIRNLELLKSENHKLKEENQNYEIHYDEQIALKEQVKDYENENNHLKKVMTIAEREKLSIERRILSMQETIDELSEKNIQLSKLVDEKVYTLSGQLAKREMVILEQTWGSKLNTTKTKTKLVDNKNSRTDIYKRIEKFEKRDASCKYDRELTPPLNAIVSKTHDFTSKNDQHSELAKSASKLMKIFNLSANEVNEQKCMNKSYDDVELGLKTPKQNSRSQKFTQNEFLTASRYNVIGTGGYGEKCSLIESEDKNCEDKGEFYNNLTQYQHIGNRAKSVHQKKNFLEEKLRDFEEKMNAFTDI